MTLLTSIGVPLLMMAQGFTLAIGQKDGDTSKIKTDDIENITFAENPDTEGDGLNSITLNLKSGEKVSFLLGDKPIISFDGDQCVIECKDLRTSLDMKDIDFAVMDKQNGVRPATESRMVIDLSDPSAAVIRELTPGDVVSLYSIDGRLLQKVTAGTDGYAAVGLSEIAKGTVCVISVNDTNNFKLIKK